MPQTTLTFGSHECALLRHALEELERSTWRRMLQGEGEAALRTQNRFPEEPRLKHYGLQPESKTEIERREAIDGRRLAIQWDYFDEVNALIRRFP